jgi:hypothetical protein
MIWNGRKRDAAAAGMARASVRLAADAMTLPESLLGGVTEQSTAAGADTAMIEQVWWRGRAGGIAAGVGIAAFGNTVRRSPKARNAE